MTKDKDKIEWYHDFIDKDYTPTDDDLVALFYFDKADSVSVDDLIGRLASESSIGTWTTLQTLDDEIFKKRARAFWNTDDHVKISYPLELWELDNVPQLMSGIAGNIFGMKAVRNLRLIDTTLPLDYVKGSKGPNMGVDAIKKIFKKEVGPTNYILCSKT